MNLPGIAYAEGVGTAARDDGAGTPLDVGGTAVEDRGDAPEAHKVMGLHTVALHQAVK